MNIPPEEEQRLKAKYGKGASMMLKMGLTADDLKKKPVAADRNVGRLGLGHASNSSRDNGEKSQCSTTEFNRFNTDNSTSTERGNQLISSEPQPSTSSAHPPETFSRANELDVAGNVGNDERDNNNEGEKSSTCILREVEHNINLLAANCERDMLANQDNLKLGRSRFGELSNVKRCLTGVIKKQLVTMNQMVELQEAITAVNNKTWSSESDEEQLQRLLKLYETIKNNNACWEDMKLHKFVVPSIASLFKADLASTNWNPLFHPYEPAEKYLPWQKLLEDHPVEFQSLLCKTYFPALEEALKSWDGVSPELLVNMWKAWEIYYSPSMIAYLRDQVIWPKLRDIINNWDPKSRESFVIPEWLSKWMYVIEVANLRLASQAVGKRINAELQNWNPMETWPARVMYKINWKESIPALENGQIRMTVSNRLKNMLQKMKFTYNNEDVKEFSAALRWQKLLGWSEMGYIIFDAMIINWRKFFSTWMEKEDIDFEQVKNWYLFWRNAIPKNIREWEPMRDQFMWLLREMEGQMITHNLIQATERLSLEDSSAATSGSSFGTVSQPGTNATLSVVKRIV